MYFNMTILYRVQRGFNFTGLALLFGIVCICVKPASLRAGEAANGSAAGGVRSPCMETNAEGFLRLIELPTKAFPFRFAPVQGRDRVEYGGTISCGKVSNFSKWRSVIAGQAARTRGEYKVFSLGNGTAELLHSPRRVLVCDAEWKGQMKGFPQSCKIEVALCPSQQQDTDTVQLVLELGINMGDLPNIDAIETTLLSAARANLQAEGIFPGCYLK